MSPEVSIGGHPGHLLGHSYQLQEGQVRSLSAAGIAGQKPGQFSQDIIEISCLEKAGRTLGALQLLYPAIQVIHGIPG